MPGFDWKPGVPQVVRIGPDDLECVCFGPSPQQAPTIVMLHEGLGCVALWQDFPERLAEETGYGVFAYSRAGYGGSSPVLLPRPLDYMSREATGSLPLVLDAVGLKRGVLLGHSDGATIASIYLGSVEDFRVRGLVLIAPHFFAEAQGLAAIEEARAGYETGTLRARLSKYHADVDTAFRGWNDAWLDPGFKDWNVADAIDYFRVPVLAIQGVNDRYGTLAQIREIENRIYAPVDVEILDDCGHSPHVQQTETTLSIIGDFARRLERIENEQVALK